MSAPGVEAKSPLPTVLGVSALVGFVAVFVVPVASLVIGALGTPPGEAPWSQGFFLHILGFTYGQALVSAVLSGLVGIGAALVYSEMRFPGRETLWRLSLLPFALPVLLVALGLLGIWGQSGWLGRFLPPGLLYGWPGILLGHVFLNFPLYLKAVGTALGETEREPERAALSLGASRVHCFFTITLRRILPEIRTAFVLSFLYCASSFLIVLLLGGGPRFTTLEVAIYQAVKIEFDLALAVRLAAIQAVVSGLLYVAFLRQGPRPAEARSASFPLYRLGNVWLALLGVGLTLLVGVPIVGLVVEGGRSLGSLDYGVLARAALQSLKLGLLACGFSLGLTLPLAYGAHRGKPAAFRAWLGGAANFPVSVSTLLLTVGWVVLLKEKQDWFRGSLIPAAIVQGTIALPLVFRTLQDGFRRVPAALYPAAASLGASTWQILTTIELPLLKRTLGLGLVMALSFSLGEVGAVLLFLGQDNETLPLWIFRLMGRYQFSEAYGAALLLLVMMASLFWGIGRLEEDHVRAQS